MENITFSFTLTPGQLAHIENWLQEEDKRYKAGFWVNWQDSILFSHSLNRMLVMLLHDEPIGFMTWHPDNERVAKIVIAEIHPGFRQKGYGRQLLEQLKRHLRQTGICVFTLHCQPAESEHVWTRLGFTSYPVIDGFEKENNPKGKYLYLILCPHLKPGTGSGATKITLWSAEPWEVDHQTTYWDWYPICKSGVKELELPIISPAKNTWKISHTENGAVVSSDKAKWFQRNGVVFSNFMIITHLV